jgi:hypothetical protein
MHPDDGGGKLLLDYMTLQPRRQPYSYLGKVFGTLKNGNRKDLRSGDGLVDTDVGSESITLIQRSW